MPHADVPQIPPAKPPIWRVEKPNLLIVKRFDQPVGFTKDVAHVILVNDQGDHSMPFRCGSERCLEQMVTELRRLYPSIDLRI